VVSPAKPSHASSCCGPEPVIVEAGQAAAIGGCCGDEGGDVAGKRPDYMMWGSGVLVAIGCVAHLVLHGPGVMPESAHEQIGHGGAFEAFRHFAAGTYELLLAMWWGILLGIFFVGLLDRVPRDLVMAALNGKTRMGGLLKATGAGLAFDLCSHGILMVGMKLYERGASIGQTVAFLLASPWNSLSLTIVLIVLVGWWYTLLFIVFSAVIAVITGYLFDSLVAAGRLPDNPARTASDGAPAPRLGDAFSAWWRSLEPSVAGFWNVMRDGLSGSRMVIRWLLFGIALAALIRAVLPADISADWFGATMFGVAATLLAATIIEVCSEGSAPIAADLVNRADAPGNGFAFLMAGVATDYTEVMVLKDTTRSWALALMLPVLAVPQTLMVAIFINWLAA